MKIYAKTFLVLVLLTFSVAAAFSQEQEGKTPPKKGDKPPVVKVEDKDREQKDRQKQEEQKSRDKKPQ